MAQEFRFDVWIDCSAVELGLRDLEDTGPFF